MATSQEPARESTLRHVVTSVLYTVVTVIALGLIYPVVIWGLGTLLFHHQAGGSLIVSNGTVVGSSLVGQNFTKPKYFQGRPSAAGKGYDPTATGGTNFGPTSKKLIDATKATIDALKKANPDATGPIPMDLVTSSASGIDPDISPQREGTGSFTQRCALPHRRTRHAAPTRPARRAARERTRTQPRARRARSLI